MIHVKGFDQLAKAMDELPAKIEKNVMRGALRAAAKDATLPAVKAQLQANGSVKTGVLMVGLKVSTGGKGGVVLSKVKITGKHAFVAPWLEYGVAAHRIVASKDKSLFFGGLFAKSVDHPGFAPKPFMRPGLETSAPEALMKAGEYMKKRLAIKHGIDTADIEIEVI